MSLDTLDFFKADIEAGLADSKSLGNYPHLNGLPQASGATSGACSGAQAHLLKLGNSSHHQDGWRSWRSRWEGLMWKRC